MLNKFFLFLSILFFTSSASSAPEKLPDDIYFKNLKQGFSCEYLYVLKDGKIWIKPNKRNTGIAGDWELFNKTGVPWGKNASSFRDTDRIVQFSTEGTMITAVSNQGRFYIWQPTLTENTTWSDKTGSPFTDILFLPENKTWCFSLSTMTAPWKRITPMSANDIVSYWEDIDGNRTEFGFTATIYMVDPGGQIIRYTDTGLPASWSRAFASPERGRFIIENLSASASAVFVINKSGRMYTRMFDYELEGGCPALRFVYKREKRTGGEDIAPLMESIRTLPLPDWREQEPVEEILLNRKNRSGKAAITKNITILLTGKGNSARELRVQGRDSKGYYGYWKKMISGSKWEFVRTDELFDETEIITDYPEELPGGKTQDKNYKGKLTKSGEADLSVELIGFYYFNTPATLRVHSNGKFFDLIFHTVDLWSPAVQKKYIPELIGHPSGEPKLLQGAIEIPPDLLNSSDPEIKNIIDNYFLEFNLQPIAFTVSADDRKVFIKSKILQRSLYKSMDYELRGCIKIDLVNDDYDKNPDAEKFFTPMAIRPGLEIPADTASLTKKDIPAVDKLIELNKNALEEIQNINKKLKRENCTSGCVSSCILPVYYIFNGIVTVIGLPHWDLGDSSPGTAENITQLGGVSYTGGTPLTEHASMNIKEAFDDSDDYRNAAYIISRRLTELNGLRNKLVSKDDVKDEIK